MAPNMLIVSVLALLIFQTIETNAKSVINGRIISGEEAKPHQFPFQVGLWFNISNNSVLDFCGGTLISENFVLTAAHCVVDTQEIIVVLGAHQINITEPEQVRLTSTEFIVHEEYVDYLSNDIALIKLPEPVEFNDVIQPVTLAEGNDTYIHDESIVVGWGVTYAAQVEAEPFLRWVENVIMTREECVYDDYFYVHHILDSHICQSAEEFKTCCRGDSGGPLLVEDVQVGIVSFGYANCFMKKPTVYTRITSFRDWIKENAGV